MVLDAEGAVRGVECRIDLGEVEHMRSVQNGGAELGGLDRILSAVPDQRAADEHHRRQPVDGAELAHGIGDIDVGRGARQFAARALRRAQARRPATKRFNTNRIVVYVWPASEITRAELEMIADRVLPTTTGAGLEEILVPLDGSRRAEAALPPALMALGVDARLVLPGAPRPVNPGSTDAEQLASWARLPGITWHGRQDDVRPVWASAHVAVLPRPAGAKTARPVCPEMTPSKAIPSYR